MKVLIVDDSRVVRARLSELVADLDFVEAVHEASDGPQAMQAAISTQPEVVLLDLRMPGPTGLDVLRELKRSASPPVVIVLTSHPTTYHRERCLADGAALFLDKAKDFEKIPELLRDLQTRLS